MIRVKSGSRDSHLSESSSLNQSKADLKQETKTDHAQLNRPIQSQPKSAPQPIYREPVQGYYSNLKPDVEMIEHENINKNSALAMFRQMEARNQQSKPPTYSSGMPAGQSYLKKPSAPVQPSKSILKKPKEQLPETVVREEPAQESQSRHVPDIIRQGDTYNDLEDCKGVSVRNIKNMWGNSPPSQPQQVRSEPPPEPINIVEPSRDSFAEFENFENEIEKESPPVEPIQSDPNENFDLLKDTPSVDFGDLKRMPEDGPAAHTASDDGPNTEELKPNYVEPNTQTNSFKREDWSDSEDSVHVDEYIVNPPRPGDEDLVSLQSIASTTLTDPAERRKTIEEVETIQNDIDEMTRKANAAISIMNDSKTIQVNPKKSSVESVENVPDPKPVQAQQPKPDILTQAEENEKRYAEENARLEEEIRAAQEVLAQLKPAVKPKGLKGDSTPQKPDRNGEQAETKKEPPKVNPRAKKRAAPPPGKNTISIKPDKNNSQYATQENQFVPEREGYTNDVICEGAGIIRDGGIIQKKSGKGLKLEFYPEATELTYPCESDAVQEWELTHEVDNIPNGQNGTKSPVPAPRFSKQHIESNMSRDCDTSCDYDNSIRSNFNQSYKISNLQIIHYAILALIHRSLIIYL
jgi:hypothetical protein